jgi:glycosyltransferase involved in cell wall biosynthesis
MVQDGNALPVPGISVVFAARGSLETVQKSLECLLAQTVASQVEFIFCGDSSELLQSVGAFLAPRAPFARVEYLLDAEQELVMARIRAIEVATAEVVAFVEDHSFQQPNWAEELLAAFGSSPDIVAAAPVIQNPNAETAVSRAQFQLTHEMLELRTASERFEACGKLPWHSTAYRREALVAALGDPGLLQVEGFLQERLLRDYPGACLVRCTHSSLQHVNMSRLLPALRFAFHGGRVFGAERSRRMQWSLLERVGRSVLFPVVAVLKIWRSAGILRDGNSLCRTAATFAAAFPIAWCHALGEAVGVCWGKGRSAIAYSAFEVQRGPLLRARERLLLRADRLDATAGESA